VTEFETFLTDFARIDEVGIVVMTVPKAAHSAILLALAETFAVPGETYKNAIKRWRSHKSLAVPPDYLSVGFCRDPLDRFRSCWQDKIATVDSVRAELALIGCKPGMSLDAFSVLVSEIDDHHLDRHLIPQYHKFFLDNVLRVNKLFHYEALAFEWEIFREMVLVYCGRRLADLSRINVSALVSYQWSEHSRELVRERYAVDVWATVKRD